MVRSELENPHFAGPVLDEGEYATELEGKWRVDGTWIDPKLLSEGRKEEMKYMRKMGVFEVVDEKECYYNGCKPLKLKWVDKMKGERSSTRDWSVGDQKGQGQRRTTWTRRRMLTHAAVGRVEDARVHNDDKTRRWKPRRRSV